MLGLQQGFFKEFSYVAKWHRVLMTLDRGVGRLVSLASYACTSTWDLSAVVSILC